MDWRKEGNLWLRVYRWWMITGLLAIPFGFIYACTVRVLHHESKTALIACLVAAIAVNYRLQGMPPDK